MIRACPFFARAVFDLQAWVLLTLSRKKKMDSATIDWLLYGIVSVFFPVSGKGSGLVRGTRWDITFSNPVNSHLIFEVAEVTEDTIVFTLIEDQTKISHWLEWKRATITLTKIDEKHTNLQWTITYERLLDPAWYFGPVERYAVAQAVDYLIDTLATPELRRD